MAYISRLYLARFPCLTTPFLTHCFCQKRKSKGSSPRRLTTSTSGVVGNCCRSNGETLHPLYELSKHKYKAIVGCALHIKSRLEHAFQRPTSHTCTAGTISGIPTSWRKCLGSALPLATHEASCRRCAGFRIPLCKLTHISSLHSRHCNKSCRRQVLWRSDGVRSRHLTKT